MDKIGSSLIKDITENRFLLILLTEMEYINKVRELIKSVESTKTKICYICLSKPYSDVVDDLEKSGIKTKDFVFIDVLSSHYGAPEPASNCIFISSPSELEEIRKAVAKAIEEKNCSVVIFDTISTLLIYQQTSSIVRFTHSIVSEKKHENTKKVFIILKEEATTADVASLTKDLELFADKKIDMTAK